jgi:hypothetical protein
MTISVKSFLKDVPSLEPYQAYALGCHIVFRNLRVGRAAPVPRLDDGLAEVADILDGLATSDQVVLLGLLASRSPELWTMVARIRGTDADFDAMIRAARVRLSAYDESPMLGVMASSQREAARTHLGGPSR